MHGKTTIKVKRLMLMMFIYWEKSFVKTDALLVANRECVVYTGMLSELGKCIRMANIMEGEITI